jgi:citrate lyase beta subunit
MEYVIRRSEQGADVDHARLTSELTAELDLRLADADRSLLAGFPGERPGRQPVHTVYVPADAFTHDLAPTWGRRALETLEDHRPLFEDVLGDRSADLLALVRDKLAAEPIEDLRIDFEDGYGSRPDQEEDDDVAAAAAALARSQADGSAPPFFGIRFKSFEAPTRARGVRTLTAFLSGLLEADGSLDGFVVTLPKVTAVEQVEAMVHTAGRLEEALGLPDHRLGFEIQVETPQSILGPDGTALVARMIHAADGRCTALHYGTYDYSAFCGIAAEYQSMEHPAADHAKAIMQAAAAGTGVRLSDGSTNILPVGDDDDVRRGWALHARLVRRSLERGYYQGWDLHPAQLPTRFGATYAFYRSGFARSADRLRRYLEQSLGGVLDEPATARALADFVLRSVDCGALSIDEVTAATGLDEPGLIALARPTRG